MTLFIAILAGGSGTRFWPASTRAKPKQLLPLSGGAPLLRETFERIRPLAPAARICVVTSSRFAKKVAKLLPELPAGNVIGEPLPRNTAAACALAALWAKSKADDAVVVTLPADHVVSPVGELRRKLKIAARHASATGALVTLGLEPTFAATGYGWIRLGPKVAGTASDAVHRVAKFVEKPDRAKARRYLADGGYLWNLGMFAWRADAFLDALKSQLPEIHRELTTHRRGDAYRHIPSISVDHGILERAARVDCVPCSFQWDDLGSFAALSRHVPERGGNWSSGGEVVAVDASKCITWTEDGRVTALLGVEELIVVHVRGKTLVAHRSRAEDVKKIVDELARRGLERFA